MQAMAAAVTTSPKCCCAVSIAGRVPMATTTTIGTIAASTMTSGINRDRTMAGVIDALDDFLIKRKVVLTTL